MKLSTSNQTVEISGGVNTGSFSIAMNGKAFRVLSDTLYQNKIGSIVREICCNAYDAHVAAGTPDVPFEVHLPDNFAPWFAVKDFGVGLSDDSIRNIFTVYFQSTKDNSNDAIGAFGLGAKTPFSYTDQFTVTSCYNGTKSIYSAFISTSGVPDMLLMMQQPTQEQNGVEIKMSVRSQDFQTFKKELQEQLQFFKVKPIVKNDNNFAFNEADSMLFEDENVSICSDFCWGANFYIIQGNVGYLLQPGILNGKLTKEAENVVNALVQKRRKVYLKFNIGEIDVTASREGVEYNERTVSSIDAKLKAISVSFTNTTKAALDNLDNEWDKACYIQKNSIFGDCRSMPGIFPAGTKFDSLGNVLYDLYDLMIKVSPSKTERAEVMYNVRLRNSHESKLRYSSKYKFLADNSVAFLIKNKCSHSNRRISKFLDKNKNITEVYVFEETNGGFITDTDFKNKLQKALGGCKQVYELSSIELDKAEKVKYARKSSTAEWYKFGGSVESSSFTRQFTYVEDIADEKVYVYFSNRAYHNAEDIALVSKYRILRKFCDDLPELIGVRWLQKDIVEKNKNLRPLQDFMKGIDEADYFDLKLQWNKLQVYAKIQSLPVPLAVSSNISQFIQEVPGSKLTKFLKFYHQAKKVAETIDYDKVRYAGQFFDWSDASKMKRLDLVDSSYKKILDSLPFVAVYFKKGSWLDNIKVQDVINYVKYIPH